MLADHSESLERVHEERFEPTHGPLRAAARRAVGRFLDCGLLEHGFARVRGAACRAEFLVLRGDGQASGEPPRLSGRGRVPP